MQRLLLFVFLILFSSEGKVLASRRSKVVHEIIWDPRFTERLGFSKVHSIEVHMNEYMDIICPQYDADAETTLKFIIYNVSKKSFETCVVSEDAKRIFSCDLPNRSKKLTTKFQKRSPNPLGFVFHPDQTYYYMALDKNVERDEVSPCNSVMRLKIDVKTGRVHSHPPATKGPKRTTTPYKTTTISPSTTTSTTPKSTKRTTTTLLSRLMSSKSLVVDPPGELTGDDGGGTARVDQSFTLICLSLLLTWLLQR